MTKHNANNLRIKREYFLYLKEARRQGEAAVDAAAMAIARFETFNRDKDFMAFHREQAIAFKKHLAETNSPVTGKRLTKTTIHAQLAHLKRFFQWLALQPRYKAKLQYTDADFFNLSEKDARIATTRRSRPCPTLEQMEHVLATMPTSTVIERRNRALIAFALLTGARDSAIASIKLKHLDLAAGKVFQDAREVRTKFSKSFTTYFFPVSEHARTILEEWVRYLRNDLLWGNDDPLFPATRTALGDTGQFEAVGIEAKHWGDATPIRTLFRAAFSNAGLPYFNPHSLRNTLVQIGMTRCTSAEEFKAWSQNLGHEHVLTTFTSYGKVPTERQRELLKNLAPDGCSGANGASAFVAEVVQGLLAAGLKSSNG